MNLKDEMQRPENRGLKEATLTELPDNMQHILIRECELDDEQDNVIVVCEDGSLNVFSNVKFQENIHLNDDFVVDENGTRGLYTFSRRITLSGGQIENIKEYIKENF